MELRHQALTCIFERAFEKNHISCFLFIVLKLNFWPFFHIVSKHLKKKTIKYAQKLAKIKDIQKSLYFAISNLTVVFVGFLLLCSKVKADVINVLQYRGVKMATNSDMFVKYGTYFF